MLVGGFRRDNGSRFNVATENLFLNFKMMKYGRHWLIYVYITSRLTVKSRSFHPSVHRYIYSYMLIYISYTYKIYVL